MHRNLALAIFSTLIACGLIALSAVQSPATAQADENTALWTVTAAGGTLAGVGEDQGDEQLLLTLFDVPTYLTEFDDRPARTAFTISTRDFTDRWAGWFGDNPPNAVLSFVRPDSVVPQTIVLELDDPYYNEDAHLLAFAARHIHRLPDPHATVEERVAPPSTRAPDAFVTASLFIDPASDSTATTPQLTAFPTAVNDQILDSITQANVKILGDSPAVAMGNLFVATGQALSNAAHNATNNQQQSYVTMQASTTQGVATLLSIDTASSAVSTKDILGLK